jgi:hypothetical protein
MEPFQQGQLGLCLNYNNGTLTVFKNHVKLGIMATGLSGDYSWIVTVGRRFSSSSEAGIKIERGSPSHSDLLAREKMQTK